MLKLRGVSVMRLRFWIGLRTDTINRFLSRTFNMLSPNKNLSDVANFNMQFHGDLASFMEECTEGFEILRDTKTAVGLDAWRRLNHKYDPRNPVRNIQLLENSSHRRKLATQTWLQAWKCSSKSWFARDLAMMIKTSGNRFTWCASRRSARRSSVIILLCKLHP